MPFVAPLAARPFVAAAVACLVCVGWGAAATAKTSDKEKAPAAAKPELVATYGDWSVFHSQSGKTRICYTLAQPKERAPADLKRDPAYAFIAERPAEGARNEVSFIMGFDVGGPAAGAEARDAKDKKESKDKKDKKKRKDAEPIAPMATVGDSTFELLPKGADLWVKNAAKESELVGEMRKGATLTIKAASKKGNVTTDTYSLSGFSQAIDRAMKDCPIR